ncbi:hypothetical protein BKK79_20145 [Cupriavidus sp. USMAA2-4]|uniref:hypothetical protein n=1 Tax=Cupriavidus sp. USMAA2-4 TaxID=876364 RepID=UPI0008A69394|nr:hypothetical protein [Cupriavidus sp. USMAA2-4]AOY93788.1 hypothetical protein BKK79_19785 [Cupriavidus sp. USMAA2-4]AOY93857.1 hypothetical protein BKK79_20145 [Cupriavidus sp. USMAA2-4]
MAEGFDDSDKIRRNLVVFSTAILVGAFLSVKIDGNMKLLGIAEIAKPEPWKVWSVLASMVLYQIIRYRFDGETGQLFAQARDFLRGVSAPLVGKYLCRRLHRDILRTGTSPVLESTVLTDAIRHLSSHQVPGQPDGSEEWVLAPLSMTGMHEGGVWQGRHHFSIGIVAGDSTRVTATYADYNAPKHVRVPISVRAVLQLVFYSKVGIDLLFPFLVGFSALGVCFWKLGAALLVGTP